MIPLDQGGHGRLGLRIVRTYKDLVNERDHGRRPYLDLQLGIPITGGWTDIGSGNWSATLPSLTFMGVYRGIVGVETMASPRTLTRVEDIGEMVKGTWYYLDDPATTDVVVRLPADEDPNTVTVEVLVLFTFATEGEVHPVIGPPKGTNFTLEDWPTSSSCTGFNMQNVGASGVLVQKETANVFEGTAAMRISPGASGLAAGTNGGANALPATVYAGATYLVSAAYWTHPDLHPDLSARLRFRLTSVGNTIQEDGRSETSSDAGVELRRTGGEWRRGVFFVRNPSTVSGVVGMRLHNAGAGAALGGYVIFDDFHFCRVHRWAYYMPALDSGSIPELTISSGSILFGPRSIGIGNISLLDGAGDLTRAMAALDTMQKPAVVYVGGSFSNGDEVTRDDWRVAFPAVTRRADFSDGKVSIDLDDALTLSRVKAAKNERRAADASNLDPNQAGKAKPLIFGVTSEPIIEGVRVATTANGYGIYEMLDPFVPVAEAVDVEMPGTPIVKSYPNKELADQDLKGLTLVLGTDFSQGANKTQTTILRDVQNLMYDRGGNVVGRDHVIDFRHNVTTFATAPFDMSGQPAVVAAVVQAAMRLAAGAVTDINVTYSESTHKFSMQCTTAGRTFNLLGKSGVNAAKQSLKRLGYNTSADINGTGSVTHTAADALFTSPEDNHVLRFNGGGFRDDSLGRICGTASVSLNTPPAVASWLLQKAAGEPANAIDLLSFGAARAACLSDFTTLFVYLKGEDNRDVYKELAWLCQVGLLTLTVTANQHGVGRLWRCDKYAPGTTGARALTDVDFLSWRMWRDPAALFKEVRVYGAYHPARGEFRNYGDAAGVMDTGLPIRAGAEDVFQVLGYLSDDKISGGLQQVSGYYGRLISAMPRCVEFTAAGRLLDMNIGQKVVLTRTGPGVLSSTGALSAVAFRITGLKHNYLSGVSTCTAVEDVSIV